jgi:hypothetical protein
MAMEPDKLGAVKLHKILWFADGEHYVRRGKPITGERYIKEEFGPFATHVPEVVNELQMKGYLQTGEKELFGRVQHVFIGKGEPDKSAFSNRELRIVDDKIGSICYGHTARSISEKSHDEVWSMALMHEEMPYQALAARFIQPSPEILSWVKDEVQRIKSRST